MMFLLQLRCAVSLIFLHVSASIGCNADGVTECASNVLQVTGGRLEGFHQCGWGSMRRHETPSCSSRTSSFGCARTRSVAQRRVPQCNSSLPCGIGVEFVPQDTAHPEWRKLGQLEGSLTIRRSEGHCGQCGNEGSHGRSDRKEAEDDDFGSERRRRLHSAKRGGPGPLVPEVCPGDRGLASGGGRSYVGAAVSTGQKNRSAGHGPLCGLRDIRALRPEGAEGFEVQVVRDDGKRLHSQRVAGPRKLPAVENVLQAPQDGPADVGRSWIGLPPGLRKQHRKTGPNISVVLAFDLQRRRGGEVGTGQQIKVKDPYGSEVRSTPSGRVFREQTMGLRLWSSSTGRRFLAGASSGSGAKLDCGGKSWHPAYASRAVGGKSVARGPQHHHPHHGELHRHEGHSAKCSGNSQEKKTQMEDRTKQWRKPKIYKRVKRKRQRKGRHKERLQTKMLQLEQWKWALWCACTGAEVSIPGTSPTQVHPLRFPGTPKQRLHEEGRVKSSTLGHPGEPGQGAKKEETKDPQSSAEYTYTYETDDEEDRGDEGKDDPEESTPLLAETLEEYYEKRVFVFIHHFAGPVDPLTTAMRNEALKQGVRLKAISVEKENGSGDLLADEPYNTHLRWARRGYVDAFHAGFPCSTFSRLRFRQREGMPGPVRTKSEPYGRYSNRPSAQAECDRGTIMACRAIDMATAVAELKRVSTVGPISTLENPPPSNEPEHLSAWELPEMQKFQKVRPSQSVIFNTCRYEEDLELGKRQAPLQAATVRGHVEGHAVPVIGMHLWRSFQS